MRTSEPDVPGPSTRLNFILPGAALTPTKTSGTERTTPSRRVVQKPTVASRGRFVAAEPTRAKSASVTGWKSRRLDSLASCKSSDLASQAI